MFKLQVLVLVDEIYKPERSILRCGQVCINQLHVSIFSLFTDPAQGGSGGGRRNISFSRYALASLANSPMFSKFCVQAIPYFTLVVILGSIVHCSFKQGLIISWLQNRERLKVAYLRFTLLLKCLRRELEVD